MASLGTNHGADELPFQSWRRFKEAFAPELIARAVRSANRTVETCLDPFGGSGTTALACQFLGVHPLTVEVNPFLADLITTKLTSYDTRSLALDLRTVIERAADVDVDLEEAFPAGPPTMVEPGVKDRWIFDRAVAERIAALRAAIETIFADDHRRLFRVLLGGVLVDVSNVVVSGKGRRYRRGTLMGGRDGTAVDQAFKAAAQTAIRDIHRYSDRPCQTFDVVVGDSREFSPDAEAFDLAVFSPPYPNSFDYTDVYNVELWALGYLGGWDDNRSLRDSTLSSHVQIKRDYPPAPAGSSLLAAALEGLDACRADLWSRSLPDMVRGYFADMAGVLDHTRTALVTGGSAWMVVGDSRYGTVHIRTADILAELATSSGWSVIEVEPFRSMRSSAQQGGRPELAESLIVLEKV